MARGGGGGEVVAVTGGTGFLGGYVTRALCRRSARGRGRGRVRVLSRAPDAELSALGAEVVVGDVCDEEAVAALVDGADVVYHLAGVVEHSRSRAARRSCEDVNVGGTDKVMRAAAASGSVRRVVYASTSGVSGIFTGASDRAVDTDAPARDDAYATALARRWPYYDTKIAAECRARKLADELRVELACLRPSLLLGPGDARLSSCRSVLDLMRRAVPFVPGGGISFVDARDVADAALSAADVDLRARNGGASYSRTYLLTAKNCSLGEYFGMVEAASGVPAPKLRLPAPLAIAGARAATYALAVLGRRDPSLDPVVVEMAQCFWGVDASRARRELDFAPRAPEDTVADTVAWLRRRHGL